MPQSKTLKRRLGTSPEKSIAVRVCSYEACTQPHYAKGLCNPTREEGSSVWRASYGSGKAISHGTAKPETNCKCDAGHASTFLGTCRNTNSRLKTSQDSCVSRIASARFAQAIFLVAMSWTMTTLAAQAPVHAGAVLGAFYATDAISDSVPSRINLKSYEGLSITSKNSAGAK